MCEPFPWLSRLLWVGIVFLAFFESADAQVAHVRLVEELAQGEVIEITASWPSPMPSVLDSIGASTLSERVAVAISGQLYSTSKTLTLPALVLPGVQVIESDFDEIQLPLEKGSDSIAATLNQPLVEVVGLGMYRKRPTGSLQVRLLTYDESRLVLRRYRRLLVRVDYIGGVTDGRGEALSATRLQASRSTHMNVTRSALADGYIFKIPITTEGVYRIDRTQLSSLLTGIGLSVDGIRPEQIKIYGNGGAPLPALNSMPRPVDLIENPIVVDGSGSSVSEILFYAKGASGWSYDATQQLWKHYINPFSQQNYYFLKIESAEASGKRVEAGIYPGQVNAQRISQVTGRHFVEPEEVMWTREGESGLTWISKQIRSGQRMDIMIDEALPGLTDGVIQYQARVAIHSNPSASVRFESGGQLLGEVSAGPVSTIGETPIANVGETVFQQEIAGGARVNLAMSLQNRPNEPQAALDWIRVIYPKALRAENGWLQFTTPAGETGWFEFALEGFSQEPRVWDVTDPGAIRQLGTLASGGSYLIQIEVLDPTQPRELIAFISSTAKVPETAAPVANQNLHGIQTYPDFVIVTPDTFRVYAEELAEFRRKEGLDTEVVDIEQIFNEFAGGLSDMRAMRDYFKFLYDRAPDESSMLQYVLLFGDGHYDFRELTQPEYRNWIPPYETEETFHPMESYTSDDYFGLLDDEEGIWDFGSDQSVSTERVDIGIGRLPVQSAADARVVVDKLKHYEDPSTYGSWRTRYTFVADDGYNDLAAVNRDDDLHVQNADVVAEEVKAASPAINLQKIYAVSYNRVYGSGGWRIPDAERDMRAAIENGTLLINYSGHGGEDALTQEKIFTKELAEELDNYDRLSVFITVTCSFGRWDMDDEQSGAEVLLLNDHGGAIALMTTVRTVYTSSSINVLNVGLNRELNKALFTPDAAGLPRRLGDVVRVTKNTPAGLQGNNRKFSLLGDPSMRLGLPSHDAVITTVNDVSLGGQNAQLRALDKVTMKGEVRLQDGSMDGSFNGQVNVTVFDAERRVNLPYVRYMPTSYYVVREDLIWRGDVEVHGGQFEATFVVPKDISYSDKEGRIVAYAKAEGKHAVGFTNNVLVGGSSANPPNDNQGPRISLFLNDTTFVSGGLTTSDPDLIIKLEDESGVNTVGAGVGHEMLLVLDGDEQNAVNISSYYESEQNSYQRGTVTYPLSQFPGSQSTETLTSGHHTLHVKAWDVLNNSSTAALEFYVSDNENLVLRNIYNYPNPTSGATRFIFEHNQVPGVPARIQIRIYTLSGRPVRTIETEEALPEGIFTASMVQIPWDGRDEDLDPLATGVYLYKIRVEVEGVDGERQVSEKIEKLAVIR